MSSTTSPRPMVVTAADPRRPPRRPGFTLLELLIALGLVVALGALIAPSLLTLLDEQSFDTAGDVTTDQLLLARAEAQSSGRPVEVMYDHTQRRVQARWFDPSIDDDDESHGGPARRDRPGRRFDEASADDERTINEAWARRALPGTVRLTDQTPDALMTDDDPLRMPRDLESELRDSILPEASAPLRVAVFLPDGSTLLCRTLWLVDDNERAAELTINMYTGVPTIARVILEDPE